MPSVFISVNNSMDIEVKSGAIVINGNHSSDKVRILSSPSSIDVDGVESSSKMVIKTAQPFIQDVADVISPVLEYHGIAGHMDGASIIIEDADYMAEDTIEAINVAVKGLNTYLK